MARSASTEEPRRVDELRRKAATLRRLHNTSTRNFSAVVPLLASLISEELRQLGTWHGLGSRLTAH